VLYSPAVVHARRSSQEAKLNLDWRRLKAVVIESDDWGLCAWSPDEHGWRVLADTPAFRGATGRRYGGSTLESAEDVRLLTETLAEFRGGDGFPPVLQANTVMAAPVFERLQPPLFEFTELPISEPVNASPRWNRPGLDSAIDVYREAGLWWPELHGLHHLPETAWVAALRRGTADARRAHEQHSIVCQAVEASGEYDPSEPRDPRRQRLGRAVERFQNRFGRLPSSLCPPDYRWDDALEIDAQALGLTTIQGLPEQLGHRFARLRRLTLRHRWPNRRGQRFYLPPRIAFEPHHWEPGEQPSALQSMLRAARWAWSRGQPAIVSTHRLNYVHLQPGRAAAGRAALRELLSRLVEDGAVFLTDDEVRCLEERNWSVRETGSTGAIVRYYGVPGEPFRFPAPPHATRVSVREGRGQGDAELHLEDGQVVGRLNMGEYRVDWES
jgi:hypothetical protein